MEPKRTLTRHKLPGLNENIDIEVLDGPGSGGACHQYLVTVVDHDTRSLRTFPIEFQKGPVKEAGYNGLTHESLIAILIDRLEDFQKGEYASKDNQRALIHLFMALQSLQKRTKERIARGVEGTAVK